VTERGQRLVLLIISTLICIALLFPGREADRKVRPAAFLRYTSGENLIRLQGCIPHPGIYRFPRRATLATVINMTAPSVIEKIADKGIMGRVLESGEVVNAVAMDKQHIEIMIYKMKAKEKMLLGIPLHPDEMDISDWEALPGIGPELAKAIIGNRQKYGDFGSFNSLQRVHGLGGKRLNALRIYFHGT
jgi:competence protein ComEA